MLNVQTPVDIPNPLTFKGKSKKINPELILPSKGTLPPPPASLDEAKERIHANMKAIEASADAIRKRAVEIGADLNHMKKMKMVPHGGFLDYVMAEFSLRPKTAQRYMKVAEFIELNPEFMEEGVQLSALYEIIERNFASEVLESINEGMKNGSVPKTKAGVKKAVAANASSAVVKSKKPDPATVAAAEAVAILQQHLGEDLATFAKLFRKAGGAFAPALKKATAPKGAA